MMDFSDLAASRSVAVAEAVGRLALHSGSALRPFLPHSPHAMRRWAAVAAFVAISGCSSWFGGDVQQPARQASQASADAAAQSAAQSAAQGAGTGAAAGSAAGAATATASSGAMPDINSVPTNAPVPQDVSIEGVQPGLAADRTNAQYTDETLVAPAQSVARPAAPVPAQPAPGQPAAAPTSSTIPAPQVADVSQQPLPAPAQPGQYQAPQLAPSGQALPGYGGAPQPGSKPFGAGVSASPQTGMPAGTGSVMVDYSSVSAGGTYGYASYGGYQRINPAQAQYRSPYGAPQVTGYGMPAYQSAVQPALQSGFQPYGQPVAVPPLPAGGQPVGIVFFNSGSARLSSDDARVVKQVAEMHRYYGGVIRVVGHASQRTGNMDPYAQQQVNYEVSMERANSIARALTRAGVPASLVQVAAAGSANPVAPETMPAGEANNRRAEIFLSAY